jgi:methyl-CpG-binding domain protein 4
MLNLTTRKQVDSVIYEFFRRWPDPHALIAAPNHDVEDLIRPLGMWKKRTQTLKRFSAEYLRPGWKTAKDLYGCGKYADDCWHIFCVGDWALVQPRDQALNKYHNWLKSSNQISSVEV